jgi:hypothetical protein
MTAIPLEFHGEAFVILPRLEYDRLRGVPDGSVDAVAFARSSIAPELASVPVACYCFHSATAFEAQGGFPCPSSPSRCTSPPPPRRRT